MVIINNLNNNMARDAFSFMLHYYDGDYKPVDVTVNNFIPNLGGSNLQNAKTNMFNSNIHFMQTSLPNAGGYANNGTIVNNSLGNVFQYDQLNRLKEHKVFENFDNVSHAWLYSPGLTGLDKYGEIFSYDANGNILTAKRNGDNPGASMIMDDFDYKYNVQPINGIDRLQDNKLYHVRDLPITNSSNYTNDIDDQGGFTSTSGTINTANNYGYDAIGNLVRDNAEQIQEIKWTAYGKIKSITRTNGSAKSDLEFGYDPAGQRLYKTEKPRTGGILSNQKDWKTTWYMRDASGNPIVTYLETYREVNTTDFEDKLTMTEQTIYGSARLGSINKNAVITILTTHITNGNITYDQYGYANLNPGTSSSQNPTTFSTTSMDFYLGYKKYELSNHLDNVLAVVSDRKLMVDDGTYTNGYKINSIPDNSCDFYTVEYQNFNIYYAYGMKLPEREYNNPNVDKYKFGFNGQEQDVELNNEGNVNTAEYWEYDCRLGRRWNLDPVNFIGLSPFSCLLNNPLFFLDSDGDIPWPGCVNSRNVTSHQGWRMHPIKKVRKYHGGMDIAVVANTSVHTLAQGVVEKIGWDPKGYGNYIVIKHKNGYFTLYGHLNTSNVKLKDQVTNGQIIGLSGSTGGSTGNHLHLELIKAKSISGIFTNKNKLDPESISDLELFLKDDSNEKEKEEKIYGIVQIKRVTVVAKGNNGKNKLTPRPLKKIKVENKNTDEITPIPVPSTK